MKLTVWIDADSCPQKVRNHVLSLSKSKGYNVKFVANHEIPSGEKTPAFEMIVCSKEFNAADDYIFKNCDDNDVVITRDILFASRLVEKKVCVMNDRGVCFTKDNIQDRLLERDFSLNLSEIGLGGGKGNYYGEKEFKKFASCFESKILEHLMNEQYGIARR